MHTSPMRSTFPNRSLFMLAAGLALAAGVAGCATSGRIPTADERAEAFRINHDDYARLGYRLDWRGFPALAGEPRMKFFEPFDDVVVTQDEANMVAVLEASDGRQRWSDQPARALTEFVGITRSGGDLFVSAEGELFIMDLQTGDLLDRQPFQKIVSTPPVLFGDTLIYGTGSGEIMAHLTVSAAGGVKLWGFMTSGAIEGAPVSIGESTVGAVSQTGDVVILDPANGRLIGRASIYGGTASDPVADETTLYVASLDQSVYAFDREGATLWRYRTPAPVRSQPVLHDGRLFVDLPAEGLTAIETDTGTKVWNNLDVTGTVVGVSSDGLLVWNGRQAFLVDPDRGDVIERATLPGVQTLKKDRFDGGNLYAVSESGVVAKFVPRVSQPGRPQAAAGGR